MSESGDRSPPIGHGYFLLWPLFVAATDGIMPVAMSRWIMDCLQNIYEISGVIRAKALAGAISRILSLRQASNGQALNRTPPARNDSRQSLRN